MKSKSYDFIKSTSKSEKLNKTESFAYLYNSSTVKFKLSEDANISDGDVVIENHVENATKKKNKKTKVKSNASIIVEGNSTNALNDTLSHDLSLSSKITSTPNTLGNKEKNVKPIIKQDKKEIESPNSESTPGTRRKKRNKSVSFVVDDNEVADKKTKSDVKQEPQGEDNSQIDGPETPKQTKAKKDKKHQTSPDKNKSKTDNKHESDLKENIVKDVISNNQVKDGENRKKKKYNKNKSYNLLQDDSNGQKIIAEHEQAPKQINEKKKNKNKKVKDVEIGTRVYKSVNNENNANVNKNKQKDNNEHKTIESVTEGEPIPKNRKKNITKDLEKLSIGDNAHTLTDLLDEMAVVENNKKKKTKVFKKGKVNSENETPLESSEEAKEKVKWTKRKWNKDKKGEITDDALLTSVIVENLPLKIMATYRKILTEFFNKCGEIKKIGASEVFPSEEPNTSFATTIHFMNEDSTIQALKENNSELEGALIVVKRPLPATVTTAVLRSHATLDHKAVCTVFAGCGRIRHIRPILKGKKAMSTAFVEFDGPQEVEKAIETAENAKIGGKKIFVSKFVVRGRKDVTNVEPKSQ